MQNLLAQLCGCGLLIVLVQKGQCSNVILLVDVGQNVTLTTTNMGSWGIWYGSLSGKRTLLATCNDSVCTNYKSGFIASVTRNVTHILDVTNTFTRYYLVLQVINISPKLTRIENFGNTWHIVFIGNGTFTLPTNEITTVAATPLTTSFWTTPPGPCLMCRFTTAPSKHSTGSPNPLVLGLSIGATCLVLFSVCLPLLCCVVKRKQAAEAQGPVPPQPGAASPLFVVLATDVNPPRVHDQVLVYDGSQQMNEEPKAPPMPQEYGRPPDYESLPPSYESVVKFYKPDKNGLIKQITVHSTRKSQHRRAKRMCVNLKDSY